MIAKNLSRHPDGTSEQELLKGNQKVNSLYNNGTAAVIKPVKTCVPNLKLLISDDEIEQGRISNRLIDAIEHELVRTPGELNGWCNCLWFLPREWKDYVWERLSQHIDHAQFKELYHLYQTNAAVYKSDMERRKARKRVSEGAGE